MPIFMPPTILHTAAAGGPVAIDVPAGTTSYGSETDLTTYTSGTLQFGTDVAGRYIIAGVVGTDNANSGTCDSVTIGGVSATKIVEAANYEFSETGTSSIWIAAPSGTSGVIAATFSQTMQGGGMMLWRMTGSGGSTAHDTDTDTDGSSTQTGSLDVPANGAAVGVMHNNGSGGFSWTNLTEDFDFSYGSGRACGGAHDEFASTQTGLAISVTGASSRAAAAFASWGP